MSSPPTRACASRRGASRTWPTRPTTSSSSPTPLRWCARPRCSTGWRGCSPRTGTWCWACATWPGRASRCCAATSRTRARRPGAKLAAALESRFPVVEAATQLAFVGYRLGPAGVTDLETAVDATLQGAEDCGYYLAIAGAQRSGALGAETIVALPSAPLAVAGQKRAELTERLRLAQEEMDQARSEAGALAPSEADLRIHELEAALAAANLRARRLERDVETLTALERTARERAERAEEDLAKAAPLRPGP
ncbi:MAG: hypothetical protein QM765_50565 [Myxococcales bacterium]